MVNSKTNIKPASEIPFPKLMMHKSNGRVVLFSSCDRGVTVMFYNFPWKVGTSEESFNSDNYEDYHDAITLSNNQE
jgi:hypothetical protein